MRDWNDGDVIARCEDDLLAAVVDGELVGMSVERGTCYGFNPVATRVWELIEQPARVDTLCSQLVEEYEVAPETCRAEVGALLDTLSEAGLLTVTN
jgi:hypothetical protein